MNKKDFLKMNDILVIYPLREENQLQFKSWANYTLKSSRSQSLIILILSGIPLLKGESASVKLFYDELIGI